MSKILELADAYADAYCDYIVAAGQLTDPLFAPVKQAKEALQAEVEKLEQEHIQRLLRIEQKVDVLIAERDALKAEVDEQREDYLAKCSELEAVHEHYRIITVKLQAELEAARKDAARYRWLRENVQPEYARKPSEGGIDYNMKWQIKPYLVAITAVAGDVTFDEAVDMKIGANK